MRMEALGQKHVVIADCSNVWLKQQQQQLLKQLTACEAKCEHLEVSLEKRDDRLIDSETRRKERHEHIIKIERQLLMSDELCTRLRIEVCMRCARPSCASGRRTVGEPNIPVCVAVFSSHKTLRRTGGSKEPPPKTGCIDLGHGFGFRLRLALRGLLLRPALAERAGLVILRKPHHSAMAV